MGKENRGEKMINNLENDIEIKEYDKKYVSQISDIIISFEAPHKTATRAERASLSPNIFFSDSISV